MEQVENLKINQNISNNWGGKREGSGRKKGVSQATLIKRKIQEYFSEQEVESLIENLKLQVKERPDLLKFLLEQLFGRAPQKIEMKYEEEVYNPYTNMTEEEITEKIRNLVGYYEKHPEEKSNTQ